MYSPCVQWVNADLFALSGCTVLFEYLRSWITTENKANQNQTRFHIYFSEWAFVNSAHYFKIYLCANCFCIVFVFSWVFLTLTVKLLDCSQWVFKQFHCINRTVTSAAECSLVKMFFLEFYYSSIMDFVLLLIIDFGKVSFLQNIIAWPALSREHSFKGREIIWLANYHKQH